MKKEIYKSKTFWGLFLAVIFYWFGMNEMFMTSLAFAGYGIRDALK